MRSETSDKLIYVNRVIYLPKQISAHSFFIDTFILNDFFESNYSDQNKSTIKNLTT